MFTLKQQKLLFLGAFLLPKFVFAFNFPAELIQVDRIDQSRHGAPWLYYGKGTEEIQSVARGGCLGSYPNGAPASVRCEQPGYIVGPAYYCPSHERDLHVGEIVVGSIHFSSRIISASDGHNPDRCLRVGLGTVPLRTSRPPSLYIAGGRWTCPTGFKPIDINGDGNSYGDEEFPFQLNPEACGKYVCPSGSLLAHAPHPTANNGGYVCRVTEKYVAQEPSPSQGCKTLDKVGNPCNPATGSKFQSFVDYASSNAAQGLVFKRTYISKANNSNQFAPGWQHSYGHVMDPASNVIKNVNSTPSTNTTGLQRSNTYNTAKLACLNGWNDIKLTAFRGKLAQTSVSVQYAGGNICNLMKSEEIVATIFVHLILPAGVPAIPLTPPSKFHTIVQGDGSHYLFQQQGDSWKELNNPEVSLIVQGNDWLFTDANDTQELYDDQGRLIQMTNRQGQVTLLQHDLTTAEGGDDKPETLDKVTEPFGRTLAFNYQDEMLVSVNTPDGLLQYDYDALKNLASVTYTDGKINLYHYESSTFPHHLTGITDEKGGRFATWDYDNQGRATLSEHANQNEKVILTYNSDGTTTITDALGTVSIYHFDWIKGGLKVKNITGDQCSTCGNGHMKERTYDTNGFLSSYADWNGNLTTYTRDATGLELSRTEAVGTSEDRTIITEWHADFRLPVKVTQSGKVTEYLYDALGRLLSQTTRNAQ